MVGRKPKPPELRQRRNKRPEGGPEPTMPLGRCPDWVRDEARAEWSRLSSQMTEASAICGWDRAAFLAYCVAFGDWVVACQALKSGLVRGEKGEDGKVHFSRNPYAAVAREAYEQMARLAAELRLTPVSRTRAPLPKRVVPKPTLVRDPSVPTPTEEDDPRMVLRFAR